ncbi:uncharacterized protein LOC18446953 isoform X1 [Amborella trichopoda]|uniref:uncharacterized protein LOC18446953 isoform X1 n=1 Tax=Amborella trichopoda TaxID=13333 RepID=UPI0005D32F62|nr:uncharacterized protein LOC18446953 isoform X1 [Amborella trichopoda]|eukprot:XP_011628031.1 uncharacterized protein LOC18446953 isoform X1 [Amborella trichopoda]
MKREKLSKFHESLLKQLYPPSLPQVVSEPVGPHVQALRESSPAGTADSDESESLSENYESGPQKLTRAQRKRLKKRKLKEAASSLRRRFIGPTLPSNCEHTRSDPSFDPAEAVNQTFQQIDQSMNKTGTEPQACPARNRIKLRRIAKRHRQRIVEPSYKEQPV